MAAKNYEPMSVLRCTQKAMNAALLIQERCTACHGSTVSDVLGSSVDGNSYTKADLNYDLKHGRLEALPPGSPVPEIPEGKPRPDAPLAGKPMPKASLDEFLCFLQCQLNMELKQHAGQEIELTDKQSKSMWPDVEAFVTPNLGNTERWVPYHTILGVHELFLVQSVHSQKAWNEKQRFLAMFVFRAHCKRDLFLKAQLPLMLKQSFWDDPQKAFRPDGPMERAILKYRRTTQQPLITSCFRIIPPRVLKDDDENLVRSVTSRSIALLEVAEQAYPVMKDKKKTATEKMMEISSMVQEAPGCGDTWAKMLTVCIDLAYPEQHLLESQCDVGTGAAPPLKCLLKRETSMSSEEAREALKQLQKVVNNSSSPHAKEFWSTLKKEESVICKQFKQYRLVCDQARTKAHAMTAATLQVQLCEYRQFRHSRARLAYGLPDDASMRGEVMRKSSMDPENFIQLDQKSKSYKFEYLVEGKKIHFELSLKSVGNNSPVAKRLASMCFKKFMGGASNAEVCKFRDEVLQSMRSSEPDVAPESEAWRACRVGIAHSCPVVAFHFEDKHGSKQAFQTTAAAAGDSMLDAERIARVCWEKLKAGMTKEDVISYRNQLYKEIAPGGRSKIHNGGEKILKRPACSGMVGRPPKRPRV